MVKALLKQRPTENGFSGMEDPRPKEGRNHVNT
jgi:hypothetical protein